MPKPMTVVLIADDLTGACDTALQFRLCGVSSTIYLGPDVPPASSGNVVAISTSSRGVDPATAYRQTWNAALRLASYKAAIFFKKIDSMMRGNAGTEIAAAFKALECECALITPAFPQMGRTVRGGNLHVAGSPGWIPLNIVELLRAQGINDCIQIRARQTASQIENGHQFLSLEAECDEELEEAVAAGMRSGRRMLYAGSAGLAKAIARATYGVGISAASFQPVPQPCAFLIGSDHPVTASQLHQLARQRPGQHKILMIHPGQTGREEILGFLRHEGPFAAFFLSGGDTAAMVLGTLDTEAIQLEGQITIGVPWGRLKGGLLDGLPVATKSGAFGAPNDLTKVADFFTWHKN